MEKRFEIRDLRFKMITKKEDEGYFLRKYP